MIERKTKCLWNLINNLKSHLLQWTGFQNIAEMRPEEPYHLIARLKGVVTGLFSDTNEIERDMQRTVCVGGDTYETKDREDGEMEK